jgi:hypothetical protein
MLLLCNRAVYNCKKIFKFVKINGKILKDKFLDKCTTMNSGFGEGWLAYGHTLFYIDEHEQAMNCYLRVKNTFFFKFFFLKSILRHQESLKVILNHFYILLLNIVLVIILNWQMIFYMMLKLLLVQMQLFYMNRVQRHLWNIIIKVF